MKKLATMRDALADKSILADTIIGKSWAPWRVLLIAACGERLTSAEREVFKQLTGRDKEPGSMVDVLLVVSGRRSGKTRASAVLSTYLATCVDWSDCLSLGEVGTALYLAPTEKQAGFAHRYARDFINQMPLLKTQIESETAGSIELHNRITMRTEAASWRYSRGATAISIVLDECAFFHNSEDSLNSDAELMTALRPSLATTSGMMVLTSSPATMEGIVYRIWERHYGAKGDPKVLVVQSDSKTLNPSLRQAVIDKAFEDDATGASSEYGGAFRMPMSNYLERSIVQQCVEPGVSQRPMLPGVYHIAFCDVAGGSGQDSYTCAIGHKHLHEGREICVVDALLEIAPPFNPDAATAQCAALLRHQYLINFVMGDNYAAQWPVTAFARNSVTYQSCPLTASELYLHSLPLWTAGRVLMLDNPKAVDQLCGLKRKLGQAGRETIGHVRGGHDDLANVIAGLLYRLTPAQAATPLCGMLTLRELADAVPTPASWGMCSAAEIPPTSAWSAGGGYCDPGRSGANRFDNRGG